MSLGQQESARLPESRGGPRPTGPAFGSRRIVPKARMIFTGSVPGVINSRDHVRQPVTVRHLREPPPSVGDPTQWNAGLFRSSRTRSTISPRPTKGAIRSCPAGLTPPGSIPALRRATTAPGGFVTRPLRQAADFCARDHPPFSDQLPHSCHSSLSTEKTPSLS